MSIQNAKEFIKKAFSNEDLMEEIRGRKPPEIVGLGRTHGFDFTSDELERVGNMPLTTSELSDADLDAVAAGAKIGTFEMAESPYSDVDVCDTEAKGECGLAPKTKVASCGTICGNTRGCDSEQFSVSIKGM